MLTTLFAKAIWKLKILLFDFENVFRSQQLEVFHLVRQRGQQARFTRAACNIHRAMHSKWNKWPVAKVSRQSLWSFTKLYETLTWLRRCKVRRTQGHLVPQCHCVSSVEGFPVHVPSHDHLQVISLISIHSFRHYSTIFYKFTVFLGGSHQTVEELSWPSKWSTQKFRPAQLPYIQELPD